MNKSVNRQLAAVMFTDIVGYTAMMQTDEHNANKTRVRYKETQEQVVGKHRGKILQYYGDGSLSTFGSAIEAVNCAVEMQGELQKEPKVPVRIGLHIGDIVYQEDSVYGDGVNIASRVENLAAPGGVMISDKVYDEIKNHPEFRTISLGEYELKNVKRPVELYALTNLGLSVPSKEDVLANKEKRNKSIAVLPFLNMSPDKDNIYFSEGITEEIINVLTKMEGLDVTARTSSFAFKGRDMDIREIGSKLDVRFILEGSVRKAGNRVRITAQLIDTGSGFHIFSQDYDRDLEDIFAVQDEIALLIAQELRENLAHPPGEPLRETPPTKNLAAYDLYLKGLHHSRKFTMDDFRESLNYFKQAIKLAPEFALPYAGISFSYLVLGSAQLIDQKEAYAQARTYALLAQQIDDDLAETHLALARVHFFNDWDMDKAKKAINKALVLGAGSADIHDTYAYFLLAEGELDQALVEAQIAVHLDPLSPMSDLILATVYYCMERYREAIECCDRALRKIPDSLKAFIIKAKAQLCAGEVDLARETFAQIPDCDFCFPLQLMVLALTYAQKDEIDKAHDCLAELKEYEKTGKFEFLNWSYAYIYMALDDQENMYRYLEKSLEEKTMVMLFLRVDPIFKPFRQDPRFIALIEKTFGSR
jgi:TolB-like protein